MRDAVHLQTEKRRLPVSVARGGDSGEGQRQTWLWADPRFIKIPRWLVDVKG